MSTISYTGTNVYTSEEGGVAHDDRTTLMSRTWRAGVSRLEPRSKGRGHLTVIPLSYPGVPDDVGSVQPCRGMGEASSISV